LRGPDEHWWAGSRFVMTLLFSFLLSALVVILFLSFVIWLSHSSFPSNYFPRHHRYLKDSMGSRDSTSSSSSTSVCCYDWRNKGEVWHFLLGIVSIIPAIVYQDIKYSSMPSIPLVISDDYKELLFWAALQFRDHYSSCPMWLLVLIGWSDFGKLPLHIYFGHNVCCQIPICLHSVSFESTAAESLTVMLTIARLYE
jgi:hypothetical protein